MTRPFLGFGLGLRPEHYQAVVDSKPDVDWFEIISENHMVPGGKPLDYLDNFVANIEAVTREQIMETFRRRVNPDRFVTIVVGNGEAETQKGE